MKEIFVQTFPIKQGSGHWVLVNNVVDWAARKKENKKWKKCDERMKDKKNRVFVGDLKESKVGEKF